MSIFSVSCRILPALKTLCAPPIHSFLHPIPKSLTTKALSLSHSFVLSRTLLSRTMPGIIQCVAMSYWLLSLSNMILRFFHVFLAFIPHFLSSLNNISLYGCYSGYISICLLENILVTYKTWQP